MKNKKGVITLGQASAVVIILLTIGIILTVGLLVLADLETEVKTTVSSPAVNNESHTGVVINVSVTVDKISGFVVDFTGTDVIVTNGTGSVINAGNFTFLSNGTYTFGDNTNFTNNLNDGVVNLSYTYTETNQNFPFNGTRETQEGLDAISTFQSIFGIVIAAAVVLGLVALFR